MPEMNMPGMGRVTFTAHHALTLWQWSPFPLLVAAALIAVSYWYLRADWRLAARGRRWPGHRTAAFLAGLVTIDLALQSPVATFAGSYFQAHIIQHLLLMIVAPPLLALGAPSTLLLKTADRRTKVAWLRFLRSRPFTLATNPLFVWVLYFGLMFGFFLTPLINVAMLHMPLMDVLNLSFLLGGCLYWWPMVGIDPTVHWKMGYGARMLNVLLGGFPDVLLGLAIISARTPIASMYTLASTKAGGGLLWMSTEFAALGGAVPIFFQWMRSDQRAAARDAVRDARSAGSNATDTMAAPDLPAEGSEPPATAWEEAWRARTGSVPTQVAAPAHPAEPFP